MSQENMATPTSIDRPAVQDSSRKQLEKQIAAFLKGGAKIQQIPNGLSSGLSPTTRPKLRATPGGTSPKIC